MKRFLSGFDAVFGSNNIFFTINKSNLHPMAILVPEEVIKSVNEGDNISFNERIINVKNFRMESELPVPAIAKHEAISTDYLIENTKLISKNIKLFGKQSEVSRKAFACFSDSAKCSDELYVNLVKFKDAIRNKSLNLNNFLSLIGYGEGLTPSFDDFCSGAMLADRYLNNNFIIIQKDFWNKADKKTTWQSIQQLQFANNALLSTAFERFATKLMSAKLKSSEIIRLFDYGHFSGTDILTGIFFYCDLL